MPNHFTLTFFLLRRRDVSCSHSNRDLFKCEDNMLFSHVKISCFRAKPHLVFHWYLYNKHRYFMSDEIQSRPKSNFNCDVNSTFTGMGENISLQNPFGFSSRNLFFFFKDCIE